MGAAQDTLRAIRVVHDTVQVVVRDTVVRVAEPQALDRGFALAASIATIFMAGLALWSVRAWRQQLKGATEYRLALRAYRAVLHLRDKIQAAREPMNHLVPIYEGERDTNTPKFVERERKEYWDWMREVLQSALALKALRPELEMHWGTDGTQHVDAMMEPVSKLRANYVTYYQSRLRVLRGENGYDAVVAACKLVIFDLRLINDGKDEFGALLDAVVEAASTFLKPKLEITK